MSKIIVPDGMIVPEMLDLEKLTFSELLEISNSFPNTIFAPSKDGILIPYSSTEEADYFLEK